MKRQSEQKKHESDSTRGRKREKEIETKTVATLKQWKSTRLRLKAMKALKRGFSPLFSFLFCLIETGNVMKRLPVQHLLVFLCENAHSLAPSLSHTLFQPPDRQSRLPIPCIACRVYMCVSFRCLRVIKSEECFVYRRRERSIFECHFKTDSFARASTILLLVSHASWQ